MTQQDGFTAGSRTNMMQPVLRCACFALLMLCSSPAFAQGVLRGVVADSTTGERLPGANVIIEGTALGAATDLEGAYRIGGIPEGQHTVLVSFLGYQPRRLTITISRSQTLTLDATLNPAVVEGVEVVVEGQIEGQAAAINQQITSNTIVNVISEEKIKELPDANAAEAIGRLPGVSITRSGGEASRIVLRGLSDRFTSITIDGARIAATDAEARGIDLSTISQGTLSGIELYKALTSDMDADAIAGSVNLVTKKAPRTRQIRATARGAYSDLANDFGQYDFLLQYGERFLGNRLGVQGTANLERRDRSSEDYTIDYSVFNSGRQFEIADGVLGFTDETRRRNGASILLDLDTPDGGTIRFNNVLNRTTRDFIHFNRNYPTDGDELFYGARDREQNITTFNSTLRGENYLGGFILDWGGSYARSRSHTPFDYDVTFTEPSITEGGEVVAGMKPVPGSLQHGPLEAISELALNNFQKAYFYTGIFRDSEVEESDWTGYLNLARDYAIGTGYSGRIKMGGKYRSKSRARDRSELLSPYYNEAFPRFARASDGSIVEKSFDGSRFADLEMSGGRILLTNFLEEQPEGRDVFGRYRLFPLLERDAIRTWWDLNQRGFSDAGGTNPEYERNLEADAFHYDVDERVSAAYVMNAFNVGQWATLIAGLRMEHEDNEYGSRYSPRDLSGFPVPTGAIRDTFATHQETVWLPNAHLTVRPTGFLSVRLAAYRALARPNFNHRLANFVARKAGTFYPGNSLFIGNPNLRAAKAWNYEINTQVYHRSMGLFSVSLFYKDIKDMYHLINGAFFDAASGDALADSLGLNVSNPFEGQGFALTYPFNSSRPTRVWGVELEHQMNTLFLPGLLRNFVLSYNLSVIRSETWIPGTATEEFFIERPPLPPIPSVRFLYVEREQKLEGQPEFLGNVAIGYDFRGFSARLSVFHQGDFNTVFSSDSRDDRIVEGYTRWDLAFKQRLINNVEVLLNLNNITDVNEGRARINRVEDWHLVNDRETYGFTADLGVRLTL